MNDYTPPSQDEIERVAAYWQRVKLLACQHVNGFSFNASLLDDHRPACSDCGQPLNFLTDVQLSEHRARRVSGDVRDSLIAQLDRGGARFAVDGQWHEARLHAHGVTDNLGGPDISTECVCLSADEIALMLRATEA